METYNHIHYDDLDHYVSYFLTIFLLEDDIKIEDFKVVIREACNYKHCSGYHMFHVVLRIYLEIQYGSKEARAIYKSNGGISWTKMQWNALRDDQREKLDMFAEGRRMYKNYCDYWEMSYWKKKPIDHKDS